MPLLPLKINNCNVLLHEYEFRLKVLIICTKIPLNVPISTSLYIRLMLKID